MLADAVAGRYGESYTKTRPGETDGAGFGADRRIAPDPPAAESREQSVKPPSPAIRPSVGLT